MKENTFVKTHGLGNEYIVLDSDNIILLINISVNNTIF